MSTVLVVLNYNDCDTTKAFLERISDFSALDYIVVVDNFSTDGSFDKLSCMESDRIAVLRTSENKGYASGNNFGICFAIKEYNVDRIFVANPDVIFENEILEKMLEASNRLSNPGQISCRMVCTSGIYLPEAWKQPKYFDCIMENLIILRKLLKHTTEYSKEQYDGSPLLVDVVPGAFFLITREAYLSVEGLDEGTFLYNEENILGMRLHDKNYQNYLLTDGYYIHNHSVSINKTFSSVAHRLRLAYQSREYYCRKYLAAGKVKITILRLTFVIGLANYLLLDSIRCALKERRNIRKVGE